jgi:peptidoglycan/LPS O-acetylase OafA/YrhL
MSLRAWVRRLARRDDTSRKRSGSRILATGLWLTFVGFCLGLIGKDSEDAEELAQNLLLGTALVGVAMASFRWVVRAQRFSVRGLMRAMGLGAFLGIIVAVAAPETSPAGPTILGPMLGWACIYWIESWTNSTTPDRDSNGSSSGEAD